MDKGGDMEDMSIFALHRCAISNVALELMGLCKSTMDQAVDARHHRVDRSSLRKSLSPPPPPPPPPLPQQQEQRLAYLLPPVLYRTSRELLDLFRTIIPTAHKINIATSPRTAALLHNDCVYFAHETLTLGLRYRDRFPTLPTTTKTQTSPPPEK